VSDNLLLEVRLKPELDHATLLSDELALLLSVLPELVIAMNALDPSED